MCKQGIDTIAQIIKCLGLDISFGKCDLFLFKNRRLWRQTVRRLKQPADYKRDSDRPTNDDHVGASGILWCLKAVFEWGCIYCSNLSQPRCTGLAYTLTASILPSSCLACCSRPNFNCETSTRRKSRLYGRCSYSDSKFASKSRCAPPTGRGLTLKERCQVRDDKIHRSGVQIAIVKVSTLRNVGLALCTDRLTARLSVSGPNSNIADQYQSGNFIKPESKNKSKKRSKDPGKPHSYEALCTRRDTCYAHQVFCRWSSDTYLA